MTGIAATLFIALFFLTGCVGAAYKRNAAYYNQGQTAYTNNSNSSSSSPTSNLAYDAEHPVATAAEASVVSHVVETQYMRYQKNRAIRAIESRTGSW